MKGARCAQWASCALALLVAIGCGGSDAARDAARDAASAKERGDADPGATAGATNTEPPSDRAPASAAELGPWLDAAHYLDFDCEPAPHAAGDGSPHGDNRICQNNLVTDALQLRGDFPLGATLVKEQYTASGALAALSVETRINDAPGASGWLYYRRQGDKVTHSGVGEPFCTGCHANAPRDFVWATVTLTP